jgi:hypothetical protein
VAANIAKNKTVMGILKKMITSLKSLPAAFSKFSASLGKGFFGKMFGKALSGIGSFVTGFINSIKSLFTKPQFRPVLIQLGLIGGIGTYIELKKDNKTDSVGVPDKINADLGDLNAWENS